MKEFRRARRRSVPEPVAVLDTMTEQIIGRLGNVSESGMLLVASSPVVDDGLYQLRFHIHDSRGREIPIEVGAHVLWSAQANTPGQSFAGLRFLTIDPAPLAALREWVNAPGASTR
ncbi:PilZ domain-containing protein [Pseudoxanthomonas wuyuanensis]|uniref:PilZ domain-containing protein n=1 Tax=Pseudoxanthomonas wuyuanensis TaxID=1073196 RepID=A0A286D3B6_9GAMM|nr:PilZ domain-containing protein [Pseudoxanthomonas wuyuanensis]KAF1722970.1 PilZ domain-containing protein [Pseudoxanthomonas wuyuanensis]SOD53168.1 PilZ domain-containing protein [Pseudoxanthomonas wuyuanensis]